MSEYYFDSNGELRHHGVKGMKWGVRRSQDTLDRLAGRIKKQEQRRSEIKTKKGALSREYRDESKKLYVTKAKHKLAKAKLDHDDAAVIVAKGELRSAKYIKKYGSAYYSNGTQREIYGNLRTEELSAIEFKERKHTERVDLGKSACATALSAIGSVALTIVLARLPK